MMFQAKHLAAATKLTSHLRDPCIWCGTPHDEVAVGSCPTAPNLAMVAGALDAIERCSLHKDFELLPLEAHAILEVLQRL